MTIRQVSKKLRGILGPDAVVGVVYHPGWGFVGRVSLVGQPQKSESQAIASLVECVKQSLPFWKIHWHYSADAVKHLANMIAEKELEPKEEP